MGYRDDYIKNIPGRIKALRKAAGLTQEQFAEATEISICSVRKYEQGKSIPDLYALCKMCDFFKCDMDYLSGKYDAHKRSTQEIIDTIGLSELAIEKLIQYKKNADAPGVRIVENYMLKTPMSDREDELQLTGIRFLADTSQIIEKGLNEVISNYLFNIPIKEKQDDIDTEVMELIYSKPIKNILMEMLLEDPCDNPQYSKYWEYRGENRGELLQVSAAKDNT